MDITSYQENQSGEEKPHKALLLLLAMANFRKTGSSTISFQAIEPKLRDLINRYANSRSAHAEYPFWSLQNDRLWEVFSKEPMRYRKGKDFPPRPQLIRGEAVGKLPFWVERTLTKMPALIDEVAQLLLNRYFRKTRHFKLMVDAGLLDENATETETRGLI